MNLPKKLRTSVAVPLGAAALAWGLVGCGGEASTGPAPGSSAEEEAARLHEAQLSGFQGLERVEDGTRAGVYGELDVVQEEIEGRSSLTLDKPECADAANQWDQLPEVQQAPASVALFQGSEGALSHTLLELPEELAAQVVAFVPPEECTTYEATLEDGTTRTYTVHELDVDTIGDESRALAVEMQGEDGKKLVLYSLLYRRGERLGAVSMLGGPGEEQRVVDFAAAALDYQNQVLG